MTRVICDMSTSLDGYVTGPNDSRENPFGDGAEILHDWIFDAATDEDRAILHDLREGVGAVVMGRRSFDKNEGDGGWGDGGPLGDTPCFVVTHHEPTRGHPPIYTFVTDGVASAIEQAKQTAGDKIVSLFGATVMQQALPLGLVDELRVHVIPVLLGGGTPLFATLDSAIRLERTQALSHPRRDAPRVSRRAVAKTHADLVAPREHARHEPQPDSGMETAGPVPSAAVGRSPRRARRLPDTGPHAGRCRGVRPPCNARTLRSSPGPISVRRGCTRLAAGDLTAPSR